jgi:gamma-glutamyltranspeptidase/glutathione hydrolase
VDVRYASDVTTKTGKTTRRKWILIYIALAASGVTSVQGQIHKPSLHGRHWMAITGKPLSVTAGAKIFERRGNAVDSACATLATGCVMFDDIS